MCFQMLTLCYFTDFSVCIVTAFNLYQVVCVCVCVCVTTSLNEYDDDDDDDDKHCVHVSLTCC